MIENFYIGKKKVGKNCPTYFIADIAANHDGNLDKALELIKEAAEAGADAAKFQHFSAETIVSDYGFKSLGNQLSHQAKWKKSVFEVYKDASIPLDWTSKLKEECKKNNIEFLTSPYSIELVDFVDPYLEAFKIGSGDITWHEIVEHIASKGKPYIIATGASNEQDVNDIINLASKINNKICIMQCNTNYTASNDNFKYLNLNYLTHLKKKFPNLILGLSDHTHGHSSVLGAISLGAKVIEKHFTLSNELNGPDHKFSMTPKSWKEMIERSKELELSLGDGKKKIEENELDTVVLQRRSIRINKEIKKDHVIKRDDLNVLRPCPKNAIDPRNINKIIGKKINKNLIKDEILKWEDLD
ncbi:N-acetylneuraminate synthase family protein [Candidatus Pelagibacter sp.]|jgi:sialic acid synthase SpsE|nr:N-acetylneuraminate synthase family protein [Candidatus Pelagibacter sp.]